MSNDLPENPRGRGRQAEEQSLATFEEDHLWVHQNMESLAADYADQWIAVRDGRVIASDPDLEALRAKIEDPSHTCVEYVTREPMEMIV